MKAVERRGHREKQEYNRPDAENNKLPFNIHHSKLRPHVARPQALSPFSSPANE